MSKLRFFTAGESHGKTLTGIIEGLPSNLALSSTEIDTELKRRQMGVGRGGRMKIEADHAEIISGVRWGKTMGSPITLYIENKDHKNWFEGMSAYAGSVGSIPPVTRPRPGHADLAGAIKYNQHDVRNILERSSARETAARVALGAVAKKFLLEFGIRIGSYVTQIGSQKSEVNSQQLKEKELLKLFRKAEKSPVRCHDGDISKRMVVLIENAIKEGNSLGGIFEVFVTGLPAGLGSHTQWDKKLDGSLAQALMSIQAIKGVDIGLGFEMADHPGSEVMDEIFYKNRNKLNVTSNKSGNKVEDNSSGNLSLITRHLSLKYGFYRKTNNAGGIEGGMTNGMPIIIRAAMKPIPTLKKALSSVDIATKESFAAAYERSDTCAVPAASIVGESMTALVMTDAFLDKFGGDSMEETKRNFNSYIEYLENF